MYIASFYTSREYFFMGVFKHLEEAMEHVSNIMCNDSIEWAAKKQMTDYGTERTWSILNKNGDIYSIATYSFENHPDSKLHRPDWQE